MFMLFFNCCSPEGFLYDKEAVLEYIIHQKREIARQLKEYSKQKAKEGVSSILMCKAKEQ